MRVKLLVSLANPDTPMNVGDVIDLSDAEAVRHIAAGHAVPHGERKIETPEKPKAAIEKRAPAKRARKAPKKK